jgi:hypothetical protein
MLGGARGSRPETLRISTYNPRFMSAILDSGESAFAARAVRRKRLFLTLSVAGLAVAVAYTGLIVWLKKHDPGKDIGPRVVIVLLVLLNARQNLRQYRYACLIEKILPANR